MKKYWWLGLVVLALVIPIILNCVLSISSNFHVLGDEELWLSFWGSYGGALIGSFITLIALFMTLSQNDKSNKHTRAQQVSILRAQFRQKWVDDLKPILSHGINSIKITELGDTIIAIKYETKRAEMYIRNEFSRHISDPTELILHLSANPVSGLDIFETDYVKYYTQISTEYSNFLSFGDKVFLLLSNSNTIESAKECLTSTIETDKEIFTIDEIEKLRATQTIDDFIHKLHLSIIDRYITFANFYRLNITELKKAADQLISSETNKIMMDIK